MDSIPVIDISPLVQLSNNCDGGQNEQLHDSSITSVVDQISHACETFGFFAIKNHGVDNTIITSAWDSSKGFFDLDQAIKASVPMTNNYPYGYENHESLGIERSTATAVKTDQPSSILRHDSKETFSIGPIDREKSGMPSRKWQKDAPATFAPALTQYFNAMENLASVLFRGLALALQLDDSSWFLNEGRFDEGHQCALRILNYPHLEYEEEEGPKKVHIRAGAHTDYGAMTILKSGGPGLQLQLSSSKSNGVASTVDDTAWIDVPHLSDAFIINLGDLMQRWTNDKWRSTLHRVIAVADDCGTDQKNNNDNIPIVFQSVRRQSIAFFVNMNGNANIVPFDTCIDDEHPSQYDAVKASDYLIKRHAQSMGNAT
mmetsp:Transcript_38853/g.81309  ORF Transcript_38853/g.81309 Transcript_38853/m.81309 type:complete len:373 (-) Transcript_38853:213-1331(-)